MIYINIFMKYLENETRILEPGDGQIPWPLVMGTKKKFLNANFPSVGSIKMESFSLIRH